MFISAFLGAFPWDAVLQGTGSLINGIFNSAATSRANKRNIQFARESQQEQERFAKEMFDLENSYNAPSAVMDRLEEAGINPAAYWSQSSGTAGMASGDSSVSPVSPNIQPVPSPIQGLTGSSPFEAIKALKEIENIKRDNERKGIENSYLADQIEAGIKDTLASAEVKSNQAKYQKLINDGFPEYRAAELRKINNEAFKAAADGDLSLAKEILTQWDIKAKKWHVEEYQPLLKSQIEGDINLIYEKIKTEKTEQAKNKSVESLNYSQGRYYNELGITENEMRELRKTGQTLENALLGFDVKKGYETIEEEIKTYLNDLKNKRLISDEQYKQAIEETKYDKAKANDAEYNNSWHRRVWQYVRELNDGVTQWIPFAPDHMSSQTNVERYDSNGNMTGGYTTTHDTYRSKRR